MALHIDLSQSPKENEEKLRVAIQFTLYLTHNQHA